MRLTPLRVAVLLAILGIGWQMGSSAGNQGLLQLRAVIGAITMLIAGVLVAVYIVVDYRAREQKREREAEKRLQEEINKLK